VDIEKHAEITLYDEGSIFHAAHTTNREG
jgi:hypothetical protein